MSIRVHEASGVEVLLDDGVLRLEEDHTYHLAVPANCERLRAWLGERELAWNEGQARFAIEVGRWVGTSALRISSSGGDTRFRVEVAPRTEKLSDASWLAMLSELEAWNPGLPVGLEGGGVGTVGTEGISAPVLVIALLPLVSPLIRAVRAIASVPREHTTAFREDVPLRTVRRADRETLQWLAAHSGTARAVDRWFVAEAGFLDPYIPQDRTRETVDHPVNRYLAWLVKRAARRLRDLAEALTGAAPRANPDTAEWCLARARAAAIAADALTTTLRQTFLGALTPMPATEAALLAVQDDPAYARAHALARPFLSPRFQLRESLDAGEAPVKPSYEIYELWTLLAVYNAVRASLDGWTWTWHPKPGSELVSGFGNGAHFAAVGPNGDKLHIHYNLTFRGYLDGGHSERYSVSGERRPDIVVNLEPVKGEPSWMFLDAKYRVSRPNVTDAFTSLHIYRDALRWDAFGGKCRGGLLLIPAIEPDCAPWFSAEFFACFGIGAWRLRPAEAVDVGLAKLILGILSGVGPLHAGRATC